MKKLLGYLSIVLFVMSVSSCEDNSIQRKLDDEKSLRKDYVREVGGFTQSTTGLYYKIEKNKENVEGYAKEKTIRDTVKAGYNVILKVYWNFYIRDVNVDINNTQWTYRLKINGSYINGDFEPYNLAYSSSVKVGLYEGFSMMKKGDYAEFVIPSTLLSSVSGYGRSAPILGIEGLYMSVHCKVRLIDVVIPKNPNLD